MSEYQAPAKWSLTAGRTAVIHIDDQNDFLHPDGAYAKSGAEISHMRRVIEPTKQLTAACREAGVPIIWTQHGTEGAVDAGTFVTLRPFMRETGLRIGTWGYELLGELEPQPEDWIVRKYRLSSFYETNLDLVLRALQIDTLLITGVVTNQCVGATCKDALYRDYRPIVVEECTGSTFPHLHEPAIEMIRVGWGQVNTLEDTIEELRALKPVAA
jgi:nicotinamidase-related amidase